jgi:GT2 family glycosyltransferase
MTSSSRPTISVVIPAYRCRDSIGDVLKALDGQTLPPSEIIVVDDCSPDGLEQAVAPYLERIVYLRNPANMGLSKTYNRGLRAAKGDFVLTLHSDCLLAPDYIALVWDTLSRSPDAAAVTGQYVFHDFQEMTLADQLFSVLNLLPVNQESHQTVEEIAFIEGKADLFRRQELEAIGFFDEHLVLTAEDQDLSAKFRLKGYRFLQNNSAHLHAKYNGTQDSLWKVLRKQMSYAQGQMYVLLKYRAVAVRATTRNRNMRALHRMSQVLVTAFALGLMSVAPIWPSAITLAGVLGAIRSAYYFAIAAPMRMPARLMAVPTGLAADLLYTLGLFRGLMLFVVKGAV